MLTGQTNMATLKLKYEDVKSKMNQPFALNRQFKPIDEVAHEEMKQSFLEMAFKHSAQEPLELEKFNSLILGKIEGLHGSRDMKEILKNEFGNCMDILPIEDYLKMKTKLSFYGWNNDKKNSIREIKDSKTLDSTKDLYDVKEIKAHRKLCAAYKSLLKAIKKFIDSFEKITTEQLEQVHLKEINQNLVGLMNQEIQYEKAIKNVQYKSSVLSEPFELKQIEPIIQITMLDQKYQNNLNYQNYQNNQNIPNQIDQENPEKKKIDLEKSPTPTKEKKKGKKNKKQLTASTQVVQSDHSEKEKAEKQKAQKAEKAQKAQKQKIMKQKTKKQNKGLVNNRSIFDFLPRKKENQTVSLQNAIEEMAVNEELMILNENDRIEPEIEEFIRMIDSKVKGLTELRDDFKMKKEESRCKEMKEQMGFEPYFVNIINKKSTIQFYNYLASKPENEIDFSLPHEPLEEEGYADQSSVEYEALCGEMCSGEEEMKEEGEEEEDEVASSANNTILNDDHLSRDQLSSQEESKDKVQIELSRGSQWFLCRPTQHSEKASNYTMISLNQDEGPLPISQANQPSTHLTINIKEELYKEIHGSFGSKDHLVKKLATITDKVSKNYLDKMIRETTTKKGNQRLVKQEIISGLCEEKQGIDVILEDIKRGRDEEYESCQKEKQSQKDQKIEKLILSYTESFYIIDLVRYLRENNIRMTKRQLKIFIDERSGQQWEEIKKKMVKMQLKTKTIQEHFPKDSAKKNDQTQMKPE